MHCNFRLLRLYFRLRGFNAGYFDCIAGYMGCITRYFDGVARYMEFFQDNLIIVHELHCPCVVLVVSVTWIFCRMLVFHCRLHGLQC